MIGRSYKAAREALLNDVLTPKGVKVGWRDRTSGNAQQPAAARAQALLAKHKANLASGSAALADLSQEVRCRVACAWSARWCGDVGTQGVLSDQYVIDNVANLFTTLRTCNVTLRWLLLHRKTTHRKCVACVEALAPPRDGASVRVQVLGVDS